MKKAHLNTSEVEMRETMTTKVQTSVCTTIQKIDKARDDIKKDKNDRATVEQVLDPRTLIILHKLVQNEKVAKIFGCISTGKEANVYQANGRCKDFTTLEMLKEDEPNLEFAVKIFKTSILVFKDRERYVSGEFRFRKGHCKGNPRKKVKLWAEKEVRNLKRICMSGKIRAPWPYFLKNNVIVMEFVGSNGEAAPRLKDAVLENSHEAAQLYDECVVMMRNLYQDCRLVHGDLSEYNLLYQEKQIWMIDVSQSVEHDHPMALDFLRRDCTVMNDFFRKNGVYVLTTHKLFNYVTDITFDESMQEEMLNNLLKEAQNGYSEGEMQKDKVFEQVYIPRSLMELSHVDIDREQSMGVETFYENLTGLRKVKVAPQEWETVKEIKVEDKAEEGSEKDSDDDSGSSDDDE